MKKFLVALTALFTLTLSANAMGYEQARQQALFLTDKMAYELNLTDEQYEAAYEINLDYLMGVNTVDDLYGICWSRRNTDLSYILWDWQYEAYLAATYFYRPLYWSGGYWHFGIYARYPYRDFFYFGRPHFYVTYRGGHSWHHNGGHSWYHGRDWGHSHHGHGSHGGMRDRYDRGDYGHGSHDGGRGGFGPTRGRNGGDNGRGGFGNNRGHNGGDNGRGHDNGRDNNGQTVTGNRTFGTNSGSRTTVGTMNRDGQQQRATGTRESSTRRSTFGGSSSTTAPSRSTGSSVGTRRSGTFSPSGSRNTERVTAPSTRSSESRVSGGNFSRGNSATTTAPRSNFGSSSRSSSSSFGHSSSPSRSSMSSGSRSSSSSFGHSSSPSRSSMSSGSRGGGFSSGHSGGSRSGGGHSGGNRGGFGGRR